MVELYTYPTGREIKLHFTSYTGHPLYGANYRLRWELIVFGLVINLCIKK